MQAAKLDSSVTESYATITKQLDKFTCDTSVY